MRKHYKTVEEYIKDLPKEAAARIRVIRKLAKKVAPQADEVISYNIPTLKIDGKYVVYFAGFEKHVSIYPYSESMGLTTAEIKKYRKGKGTLQFKNDEKLPLILIQKIVKNKVKERLAKK